MLLLRHVEEMAREQGLTSMKFYNRKREPILPVDADLLEGVGTQDVGMDEGEGLNELPVPLDILNGPDEELDVDEGIDPDELAEILEDANEDVARQVHEAEVETIGEEFPEEEVQESDEEEVGEGQCDLVHDEESLGVPSLQSEVEVITEEPRRSGRSTSAPERYNPSSGRSYLQAAKGLLKNSKPESDSKTKSDNP